MPQFETIHTFEKSDIGSIFLEIQSGVQFRPLVIYKKGPPGYIINYIENTFDVKLVDDFNGQLSMYEIEGETHVSFHKNYRLSFKLTYLENIKIELLRSHDINYYIIETEDTDSYLVILTYNKKEYREKINETI